MSTEQSVRFFVPVLHVRQCEMTRVSAAAEGGCSPSRARSLLSGEFSLRKHYHSRIYSCPIQEELFGRCTKWPELFFRLWWVGSLLQALSSWCLWSFSEKVLMTNAYISIFSRNWRFFRGGILRSVVFLNFHPVIILQGRCTVRTLVCLTAQFSKICLVPAGTYRSHASRGVVVSV